jgi:hypothetical protein
MDKSAVILQGLYLLAELGFLTVSQPSRVTGSPGTLAAWEISLDDLSAEQIRAGFGQLARTWTNAYNRRPAPGDVREQVEAMSESDSWAQVLSECELNAHRMIYPLHGMRSDGSFGEMPVTWSSPLAEKVFHRFGGKYEFMALKPGDRAATAQFRDIYNSTRAQMLARGESIARIDASPQRPGVEAAGPHQQHPRAGQVQRWIEARHQNPAQALASVSKAMAPRELLSQPAKTAPDTRQARQSQVAEIDSAVRQRWPNLTPEQHYAAVKKALENAGREAAQ